MRRLLSTAIATVAVAGLVAGPAPATDQLGPGAAVTAPRAYVTTSLVNATGLFKTRLLTVRVACDAPCSTAVSARFAGRLLTGRAVRHRAGATRVNWRLSRADVAALQAERSPRVRVVVRGGVRTVADTFAVS